MECKWIALIPAYEPAALMLKLLCEIRQKGLQAVVVDDGSKEETKELFLQAKRYAAVLRHCQNLGKGRAIKTGLGYIQKHYAPGYIVVTMDADGQHTVSDAVSVCKAAQENPRTLVLGSRDLKKSVPLRSRIGNTVTRWIYQRSTGMKVYDTQTGLRAFSSCLVPIFAEISGERYEYEMNVLLTCPRRKIPIREVRIETIYIDNNASSHFNALRDSYRIYREILKFSAASLFSFFVDYGLYSLLLAITAGLDDALRLTASNIGARIVSGGVNYSLNRKLVFQSQNSFRKSILQYIFLAVFLLAGNTAALHFLTGKMGINRYAAKLCAEILFFFVSWLVQRCVIFRRKGRV